MAVTEVTFSTTANQVWASSTWDQTNDPSGKLHTELNTWVNALSSSDKFTMELNPGSANVSRTTGSIVGWVLKSTVGGGANPDYGFLYARRRAGNSSTNTFSGSYYNRTTSANNNYAGDYLTIGSTTTTELFTSAGTAYIQYESSGTTPWFVYSWCPDPTGTVRTIHAISKVDKSNIVSGSYYPSTGLGAWIYMISANSNSNTYTIHTPSTNISAPPKGNITSTGQQLYHKAPVSDNYFFRMRPMYGDAHYLGTVTPDWLMSANTTGNYGDTATVNGVSYRCLDQLWVRNA